MEIWTFTHAYHMHTILLHCHVYQRIKFLTTDEFEKQLPQEENGKSVNVKQ